ncbi:MAG TPA: TonB-dependent receptor plug domain-containing protein, partial [Usitatibacter sp.]
MNNQNNSRLTPLALAMLTAMAPAFAQQAAESPASAAAKKPEAARESVVVTGYRASLESALNAKREDNGIVDVIKAEDITKFPDTNLAEAMQRVPGIVIDRDAG